MEARRTAEDALEAIYAQLTDVAVGLTGRVSLLPSRCAAGHWLTWSTASYWTRGEPW